MDGGRCPTRRAVWRTYSRPSTVPADSCRNGLWALLRAAVARGAGVAGACGLLSTAHRVLLPHLQGPCPKMVIAKDAH